MKANSLVDTLFDLDGNDEYVESKWLEKIIEFHEKGGNIREETNRNGWQLVHIAAANGLNKIVKWLVENGADINCKDPVGNTPLLLAFDLDIDGAIQDGKKIDFSNSLELISLGADKNVKTNDGRTLQSTAEDYGKSVLSIYNNKFV